MRQIAVVPASGSAAAPGPAGVRPPSAARRKLPLRAAWLRPTAATTAMAVPGHPPVPHRQCPIVARPAAATVPAATGAGPHPGPPVAAHPWWPRAEPCAAGDVAWTSCSSNCAEDPCASVSAAPAGAASPSVVPAATAGTVAAGTAATCSSVAIIAARSPGAAPFGAPSSAGAAASCSGAVTSDVPADTGAAASKAPMKSMPSGAAASPGAAAVPVAGAMPVSIAVAETIIVPPWARRHVVPAGLDHPFLSVRAAHRRALRRCASDPPRFDRLDLARRALPVAALVQHCLARHGYDLFLLRQCQLQSCQESLEIAQLGDAGAIFRTLAEVSWYSP